MVRKLQTRRYILAGILTVLIFTVGLLVGLLVENERLRYTQRVSNEQRIEANSLELQNLYISLLSREGNCEAISNVLNVNLISLERTRERIENFNKDASIINEEDFNLLAREYLIEQLRFWLLTEEINNQCGTDIVTVLNFYTDLEICGDDCVSQAFVLDYLKKVFEQKLFIFSFNTKFTQEPVLQILLQNHDIKETPTLIVGGEKLEGLTPQEDLFELICSKYQTKPLECLDENEL